MSYDTQSPASGPNGATDLTTVLANLKHHVRMTMATFRAEAPVTYAQTLASATTVFAADMGFIPFHWTCLPAISPGDGGIMSALLQPHRLILPLLSFRYGSFEQLFMLSVMQRRLEREEYGSPRMLQRVGVGSLLLILMQFLAARISPLKSFAVHRLGTSLVTMSVWMMCRRRPQQFVRVWGMLQVEARFLPWVQLFWSFILGGLDLRERLWGMGVGELLMRMGAHPQWKQLLAPPLAIERLFERMYVTQPPPTVEQIYGRMPGGGNRPAQRGVHFAGSGHRLGGR
eukprot:Clim_evm54s134 gene=Clim_evmTU54s134